MIIGVLPDKELLFVISSQRFIDTRYTSQGSMLLGVYFFTWLIHPSIHHKGEKKERDVSIL